MIVKENTVFDVRCGRHYGVGGHPVRRPSHCSAPDDECVLPTSLVLVAEATVALPAVLPALDSASVSCTSQPPHLQFITRAENFSRSMQLK